MLEGSGAVPRLLYRATLDAGPQVALEDAEVQARARCAARSDWGPSLGARSCPGEGQLQAELYLGPTPVSRREDL